MEEVGLEVVCEEAEVQFISRVDGVATRAVIAHGLETGEDRAMRDEGKETSEDERVLHLEALHVLLMYAVYDLMMGWCCQ